MAMSPEVIARRKADREYQKRMNALTSLPRDSFNVFDAPNQIIECALPCGTVVHGPVDTVNVVLEKCGYRPVRLAHNMLNPDAGHWCIDANTPTYCDPSFESYHSM